MKEVVYFHKSKINLELTILDILNEKYIQRHLQGTLTKESIFRSTFVIQWHEKPQKLQLQSNIVNFISLSISK